MVKSIENTAYCSPLSFSIVTLFPSILMIASPSHVSNDQSGEAKVASGVLCYTVSQGQ